MILSNQPQSCVNSAHASDPKNAEPQFEEGKITQMLAGTNPLEIGKKDIIEELHENSTNLELLPLGKN